MQKTLCYTVEDASYLQGMPGSKAAWYKTRQGGREQSLWEVIARGSPALAAGH
ncbi:hypothetical protein KSB_79330 [Ktedonobacter robiniae]|uniref:Uncharacterized protein n=1 Tax=Ktedonobacter robiniae TaxID=2778365 RepID=A0ABQ3V3C3_9CHLR|nr:hypothetical protein KSB_79330 [Ktedonobacter robiniae]